MMGKQKKRGETKQSEMNAKDETKHLKNNYNEIYYILS
jgi:hypothetical protein